MFYAMRGMFASRRGSLSAPVIKNGKFVLSFCSILINVCMFRNWWEGISDTTALSLAGKGTVLAEKCSTRSMLARVCTFISANDSFRYLHLQEQPVRNVSAICCCEVSSIIQCSVYYPSAYDAAWHNQYTSHKLLDLICFTIINQGVRTSAFLF
jgi:hypothetical protein